MTDINDIKVKWRLYISKKIAGNDTKSSELCFQVTWPLLGTQLLSLGYPYSIMPDKKQ
jgi:hypothetical protein